GVEHDPPGPAAVEGGQGQAVGGLAGPVVDDVGRGAERRVADLLLDGGERVARDDGDRLLERPVDRRGGGRGGDVQVGGRRPGLVLDLELARAGGRVGQEQAVAVVVDRGGDA